VRGNAACTGEFIYIREENYFHTGENLFTQWENLSAYGRKFIYSLGNDALPSGKIYPHTGENLPAYVGKFTRARE
jgi:hypothetical protein